MNIINFFSDDFFLEKSYEPIFFQFLKTTIIEINTIRLVQFFYKNIIRFCKTLKLCVQKIRKFYWRESEIFNKESKNTGILKSPCCHGNS